MNRLSCVTNKDNTDMDTTHGEGFAGTLVNFRLIDLIQMCCLSDQSLCIEVTQASEQGLIIIREGEVLHAVCGDIKGETAFFEILSWEKGHFESRTITTPVETTIAKNHQYLLMEAARLEDEKSHSPEEPDDFIRPDLHQEPQKKIRIMIVDDSPTMCSILSSLFASNTNIEVAATAGNGESALQVIDQVKPDIITLDVNMPVMGGGTTLKHIMLKSPCPVLIISSLNNDSERNVLDFLRLGAVDFIQKPTQTANFQHQKKRIVSKIKRASSANTGNFVRAKHHINPVPKPASNTKQTPAQTLLVINSGMGGFAELLNVISAIPENEKISVIVFHDMPETFIRPVTTYLRTRNHIQVQPYKPEKQFIENLCLIGCLEIVNQRQNSPTQTNEPCNEFDRFLESVPIEFTGKISVLLLSGARINNVKNLEHINDTGGKVMVQKRSTCMLLPVQAIEGSNDTPLKSDFLIETEPGGIKSLLQVPQEVSCI